jgi:hypothetical protein
MALEIEGTWEDVQEMAEDSSSPKSDVGVRGTWLVAVLASRGWTAVCFCCQPTEPRLGQVMALIEWSYL